MKNRDYSVIRGTSSALALFIRRINEYGRLNNGGLLKKLYAGEIHEQG
ncbi:MAG: hypothetical protein JXB34_04960 [Bacteroidales bacterium]|nr:hypothetical protein [Bacteroidales bacterium]